MSTFQIFETIALAALLVFALLAILSSRKISRGAANAPDLGPIVSSIEGFRQTQDQVDKSVRQELFTNRQEAAGQAQSLRSEVLNSFTTIGESLTTKVENLTRSNDQRLELVRSGLAQQLAGFMHFQKAELTELRSTIDGRLSTIQTENEKKLEQMRQTVDEKLQGTLEARLGESFKQVSDRLEQVYKGLGEMQSLAAGVGDLKRVLTNVKTRGTWGEVQLGALLEQILAPDQYSRDLGHRRTSRIRDQVAGPRRFGLAGMVADRCQIPRRRLSTIG
jgi:DNA recombination protein RmuC